MVYCIVKYTHVFVCTCTDEKVLDCKSVDPLTVIFVGGCRSVLYHDAFFPSVPFLLIA